MTPKDIKIVIVSNKESSEIKSINTLKNPNNYPIFISKVFGFGNARNYGARHFGDSGLMIQLNDDLELSPDLLDFAQTIKRGEFAFQLVRSNVGDQPCSRVFIIHLEDYWKVGGCDASLKYFFEDGDFYHRATQQGLHFRIVPDNLAIHIPHQHAFYKPNMRKLVSIEAEVCRVFVKYGSNVVRFRHIDRFFVPFRDYRVVLQHLVLRVTFTIYFITKKTLKIN